ncbi:hypothetical protein NL676_011315 [Syzygium grande]|nr:hypothetical protein NL676_011315 [Syzygium grande]
MSAENEGGEIGRARTVQTLGLDFFWSSSSSSSASVTLSRQAGEGSESAFIAGILLKAGWGAAAAAAAAAAAENGFWSYAEKG